MQDARTVAGRPGFSAWQDLNGLRRSLKARPAGQTNKVLADLAGVRVSVECDDQDFFSEFFVMFGGPAPTPGTISAASDLRVLIHAAADCAFGVFSIDESANLPVDTREFDLDTTQENGLFERLSTDQPGWTCLAFRGESHPAFAFNGRDCVFSLANSWRRGVATYIFWRLLRTRSDALFFHASALGMYGEGTIFVGPSGAGKSTTSLALAARGHDFLSDEIACYLPVRGEIIPARRPVGLRAGPKASAVQRGISTALSARIARDGFARVDIDAIFPVALPKSHSLRRIVFLRGFADEPQLARIVPGREEMIALQPAMTSFIDAPNGRRVFELARLLANAKVYRLQLGEPDASAIYIESMFARE